MERETTFFKAENIQQAIDNMAKDIAVAYEKREPILLVGSQLGVYGFVAIQAFAVTLGWPEEVAVLDVYSEHCLDAAEEAEEWLNSQDRPWHETWMVDWNEGDLWAYPSCLTLEDWLWTAETNNESINS